METIIVYEWKRRISKWCPENWKPERSIALQNKSLYGTIMSRLHSAACNHRNRPASSYGRELVGRQRLFFKFSLRRKKHKLQIYTWYCTVHIIHTYIGSDVYGNNIYMYTVWKYYTSICMWKWNIPVSVYGNNIYIYAYTVLYTFIERDA